MGNSQPCKQHQPPLAPYGRACPSVASLPSPRRFASACRGLRPLKNAWPTASDVYQGRGKPRRRQPNHLGLNQTYAPPEGSLRVGQYGSRRSDRLCSSWTTAAACKAVRVERQRGAGALQPEQRQSFQNRPHNAEAVSLGASLPWHQKRAQEAAGGRFWPLQLSSLGRASPGLDGPSGAEWGGLRPGRAGDRPSGMENNRHNNKKNNNLIIILMV